MSTTVVLDPGCCAAGSQPEEAFRSAGGKALVLTAATGGRLHDEPDDAGHPDGWSWRVADLLGLHRQAVLAGCPVPLARVASTWAAVVDEVATDRWDAVVLPVPARETPELLDGPRLLLRVLDARLDDLAGAVGDDPQAAAQVAALLGLRPPLAELVAVAAAAVGLGGADEHRRHGCARPGGLAVPTLRRDDVTGAPLPAVGVRSDGDGYVWWVRVAEGAVPQLHHEVDRVLVTVGRERRMLPLPAALTRCTVRAATVVGDRLEVRFVPDPDAWR